MVLILYYLNCLRSSINTSLEAETVSIRTFTITKMIVMINQKRKNERPSYIKNLIYDDLINQYRQLDKIHQKIELKAANLMDFIKEECERVMTLPSDVNCSELFVFFSIHRMRSNEIQELELEQNNLICLIEKIIRNIEGLFSEKENQKIMALLFNITMYSQMTKICVNNAYEQICGTIYFSNCHKFN